MQVRLYSHRHGEQEVAPELRDDIKDAVEACPVKISRGNAGRLRDDIMERLLERGWSLEVMLDPASKISITSVKDRTGLCLQTGNMGRMYADLIKLQTLYLRESVRAGIMVVCGHEEARVLGDNLANSDRLLRELPIFERTITVPLMIASVEA